MIILAIFGAHWMLAAFFQSSFQHRYASHRMFTLSPRAERVFHLLTYLAQGSSYLSPRAYAILHREHHAYSDAEGDPHAPRFFPNVLSMMWTTATRYSAHVAGTSNPEPRFLGGYPEWPALDRFAERPLVRAAWGAGFILLYLWLATAWWQFLLLPFHWLMGPVHGAIVNWCGHRYGYRNFATPDASRNVIPFDFLVWGELFQNNHHRASGRLNFAARRFEIDPTFAVLRVLAWTGALRLRTPALDAPA